ncbi:hypothetical protein ASZ90_015644 [hydrocarbon metagenome]|uniref:Uncharacterized protein n=1 Tax=hydrocarbon metagenome TaxID=938273 RepID=A0A0W8F1L8_9ZZZZ
MWREQADGRMAEQKICPFMSGPRSMILCQGKNCAAAYPRRLMGGTFWFCELIEGHPPRDGRDHEP